MYRPRRIEFLKIANIGNWQVKIYTIAKSGKFDHPVFLENVLSESKKWLASENSFAAACEPYAFLILHAGTEGIFSIINWWVDRNMLNQHIYLTLPDKPHQFKKISGDGLAPCVWELEVINQERIYWTNHILKQMPAPDYASYLRENFIGIF